jgi:electron transport complex protein RnfG
MKFYLKLGLILLAFCIVATALLAYVNSVTKPRIDALKTKAAEEARAKLILGAAFEPRAIAVPDADTIFYYVATDEKTGELKGYTFTAAKVGYSSTVKTMAAIGPDFKLMDIQVIEQSETPGLGANCVKPDFAAKFRGKEANELVVDKDGGQIVAMTGATITTRAVTNSLREQIGTIRKDVEAQAAAPATEVTP